MSRDTSKTSRKRSNFEPTWEIAHLFPLQGAWTEEEYLELDSNQLVEFSDGRIEVLPMPTISHQLLVGYLYEVLKAFVVDRRLGMVFFAGVRVRLRRGKYREPDVVFLSSERGDCMEADLYLKSADLVMEVVSGSAEDRRRDLQTKRQEYARAGLSEYWIIDPRERRFLVLRLSGKRYLVHSNVGEGEVAVSHLLPEFTVDVSKAFAAARPARSARRRSKRLR
jgi:Uma2 family endonuclease